MFKTLKDVDVEGKRVIVRVDFNVPLDEKGDVTESDKIAASVPTIRYLTGKDCKVILTSHLGRPGGRVVESLRMDGVAKSLSKLLGLRVRKLDDCTGNDVEAEVKKMKSSEVVLLENLRFYEGEEKNDRNFAKALASLAEFYVNDAFAASHRAHASVVGIAEFLPSCAGLLLEKEVKELGGLLEKPRRPFVAVLGGAKVSDKIRLIENLLKKADKILVGGAMAFTFLKARGLSTGNSKVENGSVKEAARLLESGKIVLPVDVVVADRFDASADSKIAGSESIPSGWFGLDIGPESMKMFERELGKAKTVVWNGPLGVFEFDKFAEGTLQLARFISKSGATTIIGGGDTIAAVKKLGLYGKFSYASTGGGATLEFLEGKKLPAIEALEKSKLV